VIVTISGCTCNFAGAEHFTTETARFRLDSGQFTANLANAQNIALPHFPASRCFMSRDQPLPTVMSAAHGAREKMSALRRGTGFGAQAFCASFNLHQQGRHEPWTLP